MDNPNQKNTQNQQNQQTNQKKPQTPVTNAPAASPIMQIVAAFIVGVLVGVIGYTIASRHSPTTAMNEYDAGSSTPTDTTASTMPGDNSGSAASATAPAETTPTGTVTDNSVIVQDQPAGNAVSISQVDLENGGWVTVSADTNGKPGQILGAAYFGPGQTLNGTVSLLEPTVSGSSYFAVIHFDNGTKPRVFNYKTDVAMDDSTGQPIATQFMAQ